MKNNIISAFFLCLIMTVSCASGVQSWDFTEVYQKAAPAVVSVNVEMETTKQAVAQGQFHDPYGMSQDDFFDFFFRGRRPNTQQMPQQQQERKLVGQGSGFIVSSDGYILTNNHVVKDADKIRVKLNDGRQLDAKLIGNDASTDIAVIKIEATGLSFLALADSTTLKIGEPVLAIGNPLGLQASASAGILSATGRSGLNITDFEDFLQTDAAINRGNSGGPLLNGKGEVIGINTAILAGSGGGYMGIGFAIPSSMAKLVMDQLIKNGSLTLGYVGIEMLGVTQESAQVLGLDKPVGVIVQDVMAGSPAAQAGLLAGDVILKWNDHPIENVIAFRNKVKLSEPGQQMKLEVYRQGERRTVDVTIGQMPDGGGVVDKQSAALIGIEVTALTPQIAKKYGYRQTTGVVITKVTPGSVCDQAQMKVGDLVLHVNQRPVTTAEEFYTLIRETRKGDRLMITLQQGGVVRFIAMTVN